jgi:hypothetical protein
MSASPEATSDAGAGEGTTPWLSLDGYRGSLADLLTLARSHQIDLATISILDLVDRLTVAMRDALLRRWCKRPNGW